MAKATGRERVALFTPAFLEDLRWWVKTDRKVLAEGVLSSFCMRATITVDSELAERIDRLSQEKATSFEALADEALREGLEHLAGGAPRKETGRISYTRPVSLGGCLLESLDDISGALAAAEGEGFK